VLAAAALVLLALGGGAAALFLPRSGHSSTAAGPAVAASPATSAPAASAPAAPGASGSTGAVSGAPGSYRTVSDLCAVVKDGALTELYPTRSDVSHDTKTTGPETDMTCAEVLRSGSTSRRLVIQASVSDDGSARGRYKELEQMVMARGTLPMVVAGLGSAAFAYQDPDATQLVVLDGNLVITVLWGSRDEPDLTSRLVDVCRSTMAELKA
jgi:hypothetical protein